jgi:hypothetical protein
MLSVCVSLLLLLGNGSVNTVAATHTRATIEELLDTSFSMQSVLYKRKSRILAFHKISCLCTVNFIFADYLFRIVLRC